VKGDRKGEGGRGREGEEPKESKENTGSYWVTGGEWSALLASAKEQRAKDKRTTETKDENKDKEQGG
jgi:hypothetical protein